MHSFFEIMLSSISVYKLRKSLFNLYYILQKCYNLKGKSHLLKLSLEAFLIYQLNYESLLLLRLHKFKINMAQIHFICELKHTIL